MGARRERVGGAEVVEPERLRGAKMELPLDLIVERILEGKVLLLDTDSAHQARLVRRRLQRMLAKKGINASLVQVLVDDGGRSRYAIMLRETLRELLSEEEEAPGEAAER